MFLAHPWPGSVKGGPKESISQPVKALSSPPAKLLPIRNKMSSGKEEKAEILILTSGYWSCLLHLSKEMSIMIVIENIKRTRLL
jgi:hypothetical protein